MKFRISKLEPWKVYEDTDDLKQDRLVMWAKPSGELITGVGLGYETDNLFNAVPDEIVKKIRAYWKEV